MSKRDIIQALDFGDIIAETEKEHIADFSSKRRSGRTSKAARTRSSPATRASARAPSTS